MPRRERISVPPGTKVPNHIAIIPDGNRRWARARGLFTLEGHRRGFEAAVAVGRAAREMGVHTFSLWGFSTENWDRTEKEINYLMKLYERLIDDYLREADEDDVKIIHLGRKDRIPKSLLKKITYAEDRTKDNKKYIANIAIDYGGQDDIIRATKAMIREGVKEGDVTKELFEKYLDTKTQPYPYVDLLVRTSGEQRTSGFLLWQFAYAETYWEHDHFPDFTPEKLKSAILDYSRRRRRFGGNDSEEHFKFRPELTARMELNWWRLRNIPEGVRFRDYAVGHLKEQYGLSKSLAKEAAKYMIEALIEGNDKEWNKSMAAMKKFYDLIKGEIKLAFEPSLAASLEVRLLREMEDKESVAEAGELESVAKELYAEVYRISLFQATKAAHLRVLAGVERNLAEHGYGDEHWVKAEDYLQKFYTALKERVA